MTQAHLSTQPRPEATPKRSPLVLAARIVAIAVVLAAMVAVAHFLRNPVRSSGSAATSDEVFWPPAPPPEEAPAQKWRQRATPEQAAGELRQQMATLIMAAAGEEAGYEHPDNQTPEQRWEFLSKYFGLPFKTPSGAAPPEVAPKDAEILVVFPSPGDDARMVLVRFRKDIHETLSQFRRLYETSGWKQEQEPESRQQADQGWLVRFSKGSRQRVIYARARSAGNETLVAIYDSRY
jgi:hypothetical protein